MSQVTAWVLLILSGVLDVFWAIATKKSLGMTQLGWTCLSVILLAGFVITLGKALNVLPLGLAYAVWTGIGAAGSVIFGALIFGEPVSAQRILYVTIILAAIVGLHLDPQPTP
ncbi:multidrug efflux SMR transporter [Bowmanella denitrificans]|uniref:Guanidinium exporter n=1 Tax=Bowmanella denitrificans TaxID=366582 RepID=A0ABP3GZH8_9ALTE